MKKIIVSLLIGLVIGHAVTWLVLRPKEEPAAKAETKPAGPVITVAEKAGVPVTAAAPKAMTLTAEVKGFGHVLDSSSLIAVAGEITVAQAVAGGSEKELARTRTLHDNGENASQQAVDTAEAAALRDRALLDAARARLVVAWGRALIEKPDLPSLVHALAVGEAALVRVDLLSGEAPEKNPAVAQVGPITGNGALQEAEVLGPAPAADAQAQGVSYLALWRGQPLSPGSALRAVVASGSEPKKVLVVPRSALVRHMGGVFVYTKTPEGGYERRPVEVARTLADGVALASGVEAGDQVIVTGAQQLLAAEMFGALGGED